MRSHLWLERNSSRCNSYVDLTQCAPSTRSVMCKQLHKVKFVPLESRPFSNNDIEVSVTLPSVTTRPSVSATKKKITLTKKNNRNQLVCHRTDGTTEISNIGPSLPHHDLAHFVVEKHLGLTGGFFGNVARGYSMVELADREVIQSLGAESWIAEIITRSLGSLSTGACTPEQFSELVDTELALMSIPEVADLTANVATDMLSHFNELHAQYLALGEGATMELEF